ncbi:T9SS type A sorting domain-containing protein [Flavobacterium sp.]|uniref:T9SS type A sorting domain-containing protein n=1 Tax=Flavobacterium sp. TaxID=239 RepID=UPI002624FB1B|nr:T9SS type A sorting domain-containing protein [Flavobacterium sp.]
MKKLLLLFTLLCSTTFVFSQGLNQPSQFNNMCDDNSDGFAQFYLGEISYEILLGLNSADYTVTHHETLSDATVGVNSVSDPYFNITPFQQTMFARVVNNITNEVQIVTYQLNAIPAPFALTQTLTACIGTPGTISSCWDLSSTVTMITNGDTSLQVTFYQTQMDAYNNTNMILNTTCYVSLVATPTTSPVFYRVQNANGCYSVGIVELIPVSCNQAGYPQNLTQCVDSGNACFNLADNDVNVIGTLNPTQYTISYHLSQTEAISDSNPLSSPYCMIAIGTQELFVRLENNATLENTVYPFTITSQIVAPNVVVLPDMDQCDENGDGTVTFNLTTVQAQISTTNPLEYYTSLANATNQVVPLTNPSAVNVAATTLNTPIFVREIVSGSCDTIYSFTARAHAVCNLAYVCNQANSLCSALGVPFSNTVGAPSSGTAGCLGTTPNPTWFYLPVSTAGNIGLMIQQSTDINFTTNNLDVDYAVYGPFTDPVTPCGTGMPLVSSIVSCSYSAAPVEYPLIPNALPGQYYLIMVTNFSNGSGYIKITQTSGSSGTINCSGMVLNAFLDLNSNGTQETGESNFPLGQFHYEVNDTGVVHNITAPTGVYNIYEINPLNSYDFSFSIDTAYASLYNVTTSSYNNVNIILGAGMTTYNFPVTVTTPYNDLAVAIIPVNAPRPGFQYINKIVYTNLGNQNVASGTVAFNNDTDVTITSISQAGTTPTATGFTYNFTNLVPFEIRTIDVVMQVPTIPTVEAGQLLTNTATIIPLTGDVVPENNANTLAQIIVNAYDPNDKMEARGEEILHSSFTSNDYLYYTIRFENTGTASAINVRVNDILDSKLDESSVRMVSASHAYTMDRVNESLTWNFNNIQLPVSIANTNIGKGYITFKVKPMPGYSVGDIIPNTASIYFDFNPAIITNTFNTEFVAALAVNQFENNDFVFYPNPTTDFVTVTLKDGSDSITSISVYDVLGKQIMNVKASSISETIDLSSVNSGIYFVEVATENNSKVVKKLIVK